MKLNAKVWSSENTFSAWVILTLSVPRKTVIIWGGIIDPDHQEETGKDVRAKKNMFDI